MPGTRLNVDNAVYGLLDADSALASLTGATASDQRVYPANDWSRRTLTATMPGFVLYQRINGAAPVRDRYEYSYQVSCVARTAHLAGQMADRCDAVLHTGTLSATGWTDVSMVRTNETRAFDAEDNEHAVHLDYDVKVY